MKVIGTTILRKRIAVGAACLAFGWICLGGPNTALAQNPPANISQPLLDVAKLAQAHLPDDIIIAQIKNSGAAYNLSADDILYLTSQGVSANVISVLQQMKPVAPSYPTTPAPAPTPVPVPAAPATPTYPAVPAYPTTVPAAPVAPTAEVYAPPSPPPAGSEINLVYFETQLRPYGSWVDVPPYGPVWRPNDALTIPGWRPYFHQGYWQYTDAGWFWHSDVPYGDIVFHYGRWLHDLRYGWVWVPGYDWAPAWVAWRNADGYAGWAPLPPAARFEVGVGLMYHGALAIDVDFGLGPDDYVFVGYDHFWDHDYRPFLLARDRAGLVFRASLVVNGYRFADGRFVVGGLGDRIFIATHRPVVMERVMIRDAHIEHAREAEKVRALDREKEIRSRPANDPLRRSLEVRDSGHADDTHHPADSGSGRGTSRDTRDNRDTSGGRGGR